MCWQEGWWILKEPICLKIKKRYRYPESRIDVLNLSNSRLKTSKYII